MGCEIRGGDALRDDTLRHVHRSAEDAARGKQKQEQDDEHPSINLFALPSYWVSVRTPLLAEPYIRCLGDGE